MGQWEATIYGTGSTITGPRFPRQGFPVPGNTHQAPISSIAYVLNAGNWPVNTNLGGWEYLGVTLGAR